MAKSNWLVPGIAIAALAMLAGSAAEGADGFAAERPARRVEYWQRSMARIEAQVSAKASLADVRLVFLGDSITDFWVMDNSPWIAGARGGLEVWNDSFARRGSPDYAIDMGVSGDRTEHILYRILPKAQGGLGELDRADLKPEFVMVMAGINNSWEAESPVDQAIYAGVKRIVDSIRRRKPMAKIVLQSILPTDDQGRNDTIVKPVNARLSRLAEDKAYAGSVIFLDLYKDFVRPDGAQRKELFNDAVHPSLAGYRVWRDDLLALLAKARSNRAAMR